MTDDNKIRASVALTHEQHTALNIAAQRLGMPLAVFLRTTAIERAASLGIHATQPRAD